MLAAGAIVSETPPTGRAVRFELAELEEQIEAFLQRWPEAAADRRAQWFRGEPGALLRVPLLAPRVRPGERLADYRRRLPGPHERSVLLLLRAGAMAIGYWDGDDLLHHKAVRRYVVRGHGKAQSLHAKTKGRSRYGARLRLQNWKRLLAETNERLADYWHEYGEPERAFVAAPVRVLADLVRAEPAPPWGDPASVQRVPMHVHRPDHAELLRVRSWLARGRLELPADGTGAGG
jgi:hypothetical protein